MTLLTLAGPEHLSRLLPMVAACHEEAGLPSSDSRRRKSLEPVLRGTPVAAVWLIGPKPAPQGYAFVGFGWSLSRAGMTAQLDELWLRPEARAQGIGSRALEELAREIHKRGVVSVQAIVPAKDTRFATFLARRSFFVAEGKHLTMRRM